MNQQPRYNRLVKDKTGKPIVPSGDVIAFEDGKNYTSSFGYQWNKFAKTQLDRYNGGIEQSRERLFAVTEWKKEELTDQLILEVGSGAGRFTSVLLRFTEATICSVDYSDAVYANMANNGPHDRLVIIKASIYELPLAEMQFDKVICFGVLQHTPDPRRSVHSLAAMVKEGGELIVDFYPRKGWYTKVHAKYIFRPLTKRMSHVRLLKMIEKNIDWLMTVYSFLDRSRFTRLLTRFLPICDIRNTIPSGLSSSSLREWVILDTFDMLSPAYDCPLRQSDVVRWFKEAGMQTAEAKVVQYGSSNTVTFVRGRR